MEVILADLVTSADRGSSRWEAERVHCGAHVDRASTPLMRQKDLNLLFVALHY